MEIDFEKLKKFTCADFDCEGELLIEESDLKKAAAGDIVHKIVATCDLCSISVVLTYELTHAELYEENSFYDFDLNIEEDEYEN